MDPRAESLAIRRLRIFARVCLVWGLILILRLIDLQVISHDNIARLADSQQIRNVEVQAPRGGIYDRNGEALAMSVKSTRSSSTRSASRTPPSQPISYLPS